MKKKTIAIIPIRSGSKGIKHKNIKKLNKKRLAFYVVDEALKSKVFSNILISTDSEKYINILKKKYGNKVIYHKRPKSLSTDLSSTDHLILHVLKNFKEYNSCTLIQATSPLLKSFDLEAGYRKFLFEKLDSLFSSYEFKKFVWKKINKKTSPLNYNPSKRPMRQKNNNFVLENGAFYIFNIKKFMKKKSRLFGKVGTYLMPEIRSGEIDTLEDFKLIEFILKKI